jgi:hypothetical protein
MARKQRFSRFLFLLNGSLFFLGALTAWPSGRFWLTLVHGLAAVFNGLAFLQFNHPRRKPMLNLLVLLLNVAVAGAVALDYYWSGAQYIQYAWAMAAIVSVIALFIHARKAQALPS